LNEAIARCEVVIITLMIGVLFLTNAYAILARYLASSYPSWIIEVSEFLMIGVVFLGGAWLYRERRQIAVNALLVTLPNNGTAFRVLTAVGEAAVLCFALLTIWQAVLYQPILAQTTTPVLGLPRNLTTVFVPLAYVSIMLTSIEALLWPEHRPLVGHFAPVSEQELLVTEKNAR
jgi:TRAP-type C4-dicarboxylate transport system permease small subunit